MTDTIIQLESGRDGVQSIKQSEWDDLSLQTDRDGRFLTGGPLYVSMGDNHFLELHTLRGKPVAIVPD